ncbi:hypothetical protein RhiirA4_551404 [Rhizophagus irregularis]|uniref:Secreted protein n=1 Tax=Rhizophagus irregularis TaxID=588596 RepID=A0A2I1HW54_9GLOM|nr:hypothetical protein RhiirA4_551404 [Rhizophagus irregularis]
MVWLSHGHVHSATVYLFWLHVMCNSATTNTNQHQSTLMKLEPLFPISGLGSAESDAYLLLGQDHHVTKIKKRFSRTRYVPYVGGYDN